MDGHDPDPTFVDTPTSNDLAQPLNQAGAPPCGCSPKLAGSFQLKGATNPSDKGKITDAIADAFAKENKGRESDLKSTQLPCYVTCTQRLCIMIKKSNG